ncbi:MAG: two-component regulator propeller domain-containing protein [Haliscomenobacter sp.]|uniref:two-component regulator propeller domain-containing protein n=1 Tax=Haliscomenobacter sp. TaxID=2717303 RepID=UPI0029A21787|nr:two-component regulator propeller domain-containing protein [Haliscomenobacter sp.]MDX2071820.1 two-component regulator propeller domain-containing protein [Haliscomenobacter sp.]
MASLLHKMYCFCLLLITAGTTYSCTQHPKEQPLRHQIKVVKAQGYIVPLDSITTPKVIPVDENKLTKIPMGKPKVVPIPTNIHPAGKPKVVKAGKPRICTPGKDGFSLPKIVPAIDSPFVAGLPKVVRAKEAYVKDSNPKNFSSFTKLQGLTNNSINCMLKDQNGNLWIGTDGGGASKYDGQNFTHFTQKEGLSNNYISCLLEDKSGNLWFGTYGGGVSKYDGKNFTHFTEKEGLINNYVSSSLIDKNGNFWFGTYGGGVSKYDGKKFIHFTEKEGLSNNQIFKIFEDKHGNLWFGTLGSGVSKYDGHRFTHFSEKEGLSNNVVGSIFEDNIGNLWFGTVGGLSKYDGQSFTHFTEKEGLSSNPVWSIFEDKSKNLWFGTEMGVSKYDGHRFTHFTENEGLSSYGVWSIIEDKSGNLWFGTWVDGVIQYHGQNFTHYSNKEGLSDNLVESTLMDKNGNLWFGTRNAGVSKYDGRNFTHYTIKEGLNSNFIRSIVEDKNGNLWFGSHADGISKCDGKTYTHFTTKEGLGNNFVRCILEDKRGDLWIGTGKGITKYDGNCFTHYTEKEGLSNDLVYSILEDKKGNLWFGTDVGVTKFDGHRYTHYTEKEGLSNKGIEHILEDSSGNLWFSTDGDGALKYDGLHFTHFTEAEGLSDNHVRSILEDKSGSLWFGTSLGLSELKSNKIAEITRKIQSGTLHESEVIFTNYTYEDGFFGVGVNLGKTICKDKNGDIWIGTDDRLTVLHPSAIKDQTAAPNIQLTSVALFNENIPWMQLAHTKDTAFALKNGVIVQDFSFDGTSKWYNLPEQLSLAYNNNYLTFNFVGITLQSPGKVKYQYQLQGLEDNWNALTTRSEATYGNLPPGSYTFKVKARSGVGIWSRVFEYRFTIRRPWWKTGWAYAFYSLTLFGCIFGFIYWRSAALRRENRILEEKVSLRTRQLQQKSTELETSLGTLKSTQSQLIQSEKLASLGELTAGIAHEIQNPLNFVNNFAEVSAEMLDEMHEELEKGDTTEAIAIATDLKTNLEKINHHGQRASSIVKGMLEHSRASTGVKEPTDINALADEYLRLVYHGLRAKDNNFNATMETHFEPNLPLVSVIPQDIGRVLLNLINNAFYAVAERSRSTVQQRASVGVTSSHADTMYQPVVTVSTQKTGDHIIIKVQDNGNGIPDAIKDKIFQPFFTTKPTGQGTGLGLSLAYDIVAKGHGGSLEVVSNEKEGSEFIFHLPC